MNASQERREAEKQEAIEKVVTKLSKKLEDRPRFVSVDGMVMPLLEPVLNRIPSNYEVREVFVEQVAMQPSTLTIPKGKPQIVTLYYPLIEKINP